jgi:pyruvate kinase
MTSTGIIATIGPATNNAATLRALHAAGMTVARLNEFHNDLLWHRETSANAGAIGIVADSPAGLFYPG